MDPKMSVIMRWGSSVIVNEKKNEYSINHIILSSVSCNFKYLME